MPDQSEFKEFYNEHLKGKIDKLEEERSTIFNDIQNYIKKWRKIAAIIAGVTGIIIVFVVGFPFLKSVQLFIFSFIFIWLIIYVAGIYRGYHKKNKTLHAIHAPFKARIIEPLIEHFHPSLKYYPEEQVPMEEVKESLLFQQKISDNRGDDLITGQMEGVNFKLSELHLAHKQRRSNSSGTTDLRNVDFFKGIFLAGECPGNIEATTVILPDWRNIEKDETFAAKMDYSKRKGQNLRENEWFPEDVPGGQGLQKIDLNDESFDPYFHVYSTKPQETTKILQNGLKKQLLLLRQLGFEPNTVHQVDNKRLSNYEERAVYFSITGNKFFMAKPYNRPFFKPALSQPIDNPAVIKQFYKDLDLMVHLVKGFSLTLREKLSEG